MSRKDRPLLRAGVGGLTTICSFSERETKLSRHGSSEKLSSLTAGGLSGGVRGVLFRGGAGPVGLRQTSVSSGSKIVAKQEKVAPQVNVSIRGNVTNAKVLATGAGRRSIAMVGRADCLCIAASSAKIFSAVANVSK